MSKDHLQGYRQKAGIAERWEHDASDVEHDQASMERAYSTWALGDNVAHEIGGRNTTTRYLLHTAMEESAEAVKLLIEVNFDSAEGLANAKALQSRAIRYRELVEWLAEAIQAGTTAAEELQEYRDELLTTGALDGTGVADGNGEDDGDF